MLALANGTVAMGFTLCPTRREFVLSRRALECPQRGPYYSLNEAREPEWPDGLRRWVSDAKRGAVPSGTKFSARDVGALVADVHRTLLRGGWAGDPRPHLRHVTHGPGPTTVATTSWIPNSSSRGQRLTSPALP